MAARESVFFETAASEVYGQAALQLGLNGLDTLAATHAKRRVYAGDDAACSVRCDVHHLPLAAESVNAVTLPHTLELCGHPQQILRETYRVLKAEGRLVVTALNPYGPWWWSRLWREVLPPRRDCIRIARLKDWLELLGFEIVAGQFMVYTPPLQDAARLHKLNFLNHAGNRWWPQYAAAYGLVAVKRVASLRLIKPQWYEEKAAVPGWAAPAKIRSSDETR